MADLSKLLIDTMTFTPTVLEESAGGPGKYVARGEFARSDKPTQNGRYYPESLWRREIGRLSKQMAENRVYGELDHPMDGRTQLKRASHIITDLRIEGSQVVGEAHIMDTSAGKELKAIFDAGGSVGVSSRGFGTTKPNMKGEDVVQDDYKLMTFDFVADPAMSSAYPKISTESKERSTTQPKVAEASEKVMPEEITLEQVREEHPDLYESLVSDAEREYEKRAAEIWAKKIQGAKEETEADLRKEFADRLEQVLADSKKDIEESVRSRLLGDPNVAGAKTALEEVKSVLRPYIVPEDVDSVVSEKDAEIEELQRRVADKDLEIVSLREENSKLASIAKEAGYRYRLESKLHGVDHADLVRNLIGDVSQYESAQELDERVADIVEEINSQRAEEEQHRTELEKLREEVETQRLATRKAIEASKQLSVQLYAEQRLRNHPEAEQLQSLIEQIEPQSKAEVDAILAKTKREPRLHEDLDSIRSRVRNLTNSGTQEHLQEWQEDPNKGVLEEGSQNYNGTGLNLAEFKNLAGLEDPNRN